MKARTIVLLAAAVLASGCAIKRESLPLSSCRLDSTPVLTRVPGLEEGEFSSPLAPDALSPYEEQLARDLDAAYSQREFSEPQAPGETPELRQLILSGGGQWGSFGTGFMRGWARREGDVLPKFDSVTGVSTGALQATLAFLGRRPAPDDRIFPVDEDFKAGWKGDPERQFDVDDLKAGYWISKPDSLYHYSGTLGVIRHGTAGSLAPLERRMRRIVTRETLEAVKHEGENHRTLRVALVDWDSGQAVSVDMVKLAGQLRPDGSNFAAVQQCYLSVLMAASSETLAMPPVRVGDPDGGGPDTLYYDAGIRFGVFAGQGLAAARKALENHPGVRSSLYIIANNELRVDPISDAKRAKWNALDLAGRGRQILVNQVYLMSIERIFAGAEGQGASVRFAYVRQDNVQTCRGRPDVKAEKERIGEGQHFYPLFMQCLMEVGYQRGVDANWDH
jgi:predicted acylesterase/phospholipase RssA